jgi:hypothetical protein
MACQRDQRISELAVDCSWVAGGGGTCVVQQQAAVGLAAKQVSEVALHIFMYQTGIANGQSDPWGFIFQLTHSTDLPRPVAF